MYELLSFLRRNSRITKEQGKVSLARLQDTKPLRRLKQRIHTKEPDGTKRPGQRLSIVRSFGVEKLFMETIRGTHFCIVLLAIL